MLVLVHGLDMGYNSIKDYYDSFENKAFELPCRSINEIYYGYERYFDFVCKNDPNLYYLVDEYRPDYIIGFGSIKDSALSIQYHYGNIGYGVRPQERNKGYGTLLLKLLLLKCEELGMHKVCVSCLEENVPSRKIIIHNNGRFAKRFLYLNSSKYGLKYWIKLHPTLQNRLKRFRKYLS